MNPLLPAGAYSESWQEVTASPEYLSLVEQSGRTVSSRVELIDAAGDSVGSIPVDSAAVSCDGTADEQWECSFSVSDSSLMPSRVTDPLHPLSGVRVRVWWQLLLPGGWAEVPLGVYMPSRPSISHQASGLSFTFSGRDIISEVRRNAWEPMGSLRNYAGQTHSAAISAILSDRAPGLPTKITGVSSRLPSPIYEVGEPGRDPMEDVRAIADAGSLRVYASRDGVITAEPRIKTSPRILDASARVTDLSRSLDDTDLVNRVTVRSSKSDIDPPVYATVQDDDPSSPTWVGRGRVWTATVERDTLTTAADCRALAQAILMERRQLVETITVSIPARPDLDPGDVLAISDPASGTTGLWEVTGWSLDLAPGSSMQVNVAPRRMPIS